MTATTVAGALASLSELEFGRGEWGAAYGCATESVRRAYSDGSIRDRMRGLVQLTLVEAGLGRCDDCRRHGLEAVGLSRNSSEPVFEALAHQALGFLELGLGRIDHAVSCLEGVVGVSDEQPDASALLVAGVADLADAYLRSGNRRGAEQMLARLSRGDYTGGQDGRVLLARTRCLLAPPDTFSRLFAFPSRSA